MATTLISLLFPHEARVFPGQRWVNISLRCAHLVGVAGIATVVPALSVLGAVFGLVQIVCFWSTAAWLFELKGLTIIFKTMLLALALAVPSLRGEIFIAIIVMSGLIAHAPARVRSRPWLKLPAAGESH